VTSGRLSRRAAAKTRAASVLTLAGVLAAAAVRATVVVVTVEGVSMSPTLQPGDRVLVLRRRLRSIRHGDVIAFRRPQDSRSAGGQLPPEPAWLVKRVVAVAGDLLPDRVPGTQGAVVPPGHVYVLGDGSRSWDSRHWGCLPLEDVLGVVVTRLHTAAG
jgi:signal peptidase I